MDSMKQFIEKRKRTLQEETAKFRGEYDAVIAYLNSAMRKAERNCRELTDESDYDKFRKKCVPSLNWLQEQYDIILLMHSLCQPTTCEELESTPDHCLDLPVANESKPTEILPVAIESKRTEILPMANKGGPVEILPVANKSRPVEILPVATESRRTEISTFANESRPTEILRVAKESRSTEILPLRNEARPIEILPVRNESGPIEIREHENDAPVYASASSDTSKEKPCLVTSLPVHLPDLPSSLASPVPDTTVQSPAKSTAESVVSSLVSESGKTKQSLEITSAIPKYRICEATVECMATLITSPYLIWVQVKPRDCQLEDLLEELTNYHKKLKREDPDYRFHSKPKVGQLVSAQFVQDDVWYRAYVLAVFEKPNPGKPGKKRLEMDVGYVDYGNSERLPLSRVRPLPEKFRKLPFQAFVCALSQIGPATPTGWSDDVVEQFSKLNCSQLLTVRFSKPLPNCPIMFIDILKSKPVGRSNDGNVYKELTEKLILDGQAVRMPDNTHVVKWYNETCANTTQPTTNPDERMISSLTYAVSHYAHMPIVDIDLFRNLDLHGAQAGKSFPSKDERWHQLNSYQLPSMPSANSSHAQLTALPGTFDNSRPSLNDCQPVLPKSDRLQLQSVNDVQVGSLKKVDGGRPPSQGLFKNDIDVSQSVLNACPVSELKGSKSETQQKLDTLRGSTEFSHDCHSDGYFGPAEVSASSGHLKVSCKPQMEDANSLDGLIADFGQRKASFFQDQTTSSGTFVTAAQSGVGSSASREFHSLENGSKSDGKMDLVGRRRLRGRRMGTRNSGHQTVEGVPRSLDGQEYSGSTLSQPPSSSCSLQQKMNETKAYVESLAISGWPEKIARKALEDELGNGYRDDITVSPPNAAFEVSPLKSEFGGIASNADVHDEDVEQDWRRHESKRDQLQKLEQNLTQKPDQAEGRRFGQEWSEQEVTETVSRVVVPDEGFIRVVMSHSESPSRFWVHLINENAPIIDYIGDELKRHYADGISLDDAWATEALKTDKIFRDYGICCACSSMDCEFYRAEVISGNRSEKGELKVKVFYVDFGNSEWIDAAQMLPLPPSLLSIPPLAIRCSLFGVEPVPVDGESSCHWSKEAIDVFIDLCGFTRELHGHFLSQVKPGDSFYVSRDRPLRLRLEVPSEVPSDKPEEINQELLMRGLARPAKQRQPAREEPVQLEIEETRDEMDNWDPMAEDFLSHRNSYQVDVDDPGVATVNYKAQDEQRICKFFNSKNSRCWRGDDCRYEHVAYGGVVTTTDRREVTGVFDDELQLELPPVGSWVIVNVTCVIDPSHFFVVLPFGARSRIENPFEEVKFSSSQHDEGYDDRIPSPSSNSNDSLEYLMDRLQECYKSRVYVDNDLTVYAEGEVVVVRFTQDERWHRAKIITSDPDNNRVQVLYLDFGNKEWVDNERVRQIEMQFLCLPFQAVECRLPLCANDASGKWSEVAEKLFLDLTRGQFLVARVVQRGPGGVLYLELYNTRNGDVNINKALMTKGYARTPDRLLIPCAQPPKTSPKPGMASTFKDRWVLLPG